MLNFVQKETIHCKDYLINFLRAHTIKTYLLNYYKTKEEGCYYPLLKISTYLSMIIYNLYYQKSRHFT